MSGAVTVLVALGVALAVALTVRAGVDPLGVVLLGLIVALGALGIAVARRSGTDRVNPAICDACGGLVSANAPYCKHCGAPRGEPED